jgi:prepilin-type N-terminal cleavage/methylation domain-containing protein
LVGAAEDGVTLVEMMVSVVILTVVSLAVSTLLVENTQINAREQLRVEAQGNARNCVARIVSTLRSAGWDPGDHGIPTVTLDPDPGDGISQIEVFIDRDGNGITSGTANEQVLFRHVGDHVEWSTDGSGNFRVLAANITNDADGDGTIEPMFTPDDATDPSRIVIQVTAVASHPDPQTREPIRFTATDEVVLRKEL